MDLAFLSAGQLRVFYQQERGFGAAYFTDLPLNLVAAAAADLDGDGCSDLYFRAADGSLGILFGSSKGLCLENIVYLPCTAEALHSANSGSTANVIEYDMAWKPAVVSLVGKSYLFAVEEDGFSLYSCSGKRALSRRCTLSARRLLPPPPVISLETGLKIWPSPSFPTGIKLPTAASI